MTASFATLSFPRPTQRPISFVHYNGPKEIGKSTTTRASRDNGAIDDSLKFTETISFREIVEPSGPASREPPTVIVDDKCFETHGVTQQDGSERSTIDGALAERRVSTDADQMATYQDNGKRRGSLSSVLQRSASRQRTPSARPAEIDDAEYDYLFSSPIETQDPSSPTGSSRSSRRSLSESDLELDISDDNSLHISNRQPKKNRQCSYSEQSGEPLSFRSLRPESSMPVGTSKEHSRQFEQDRLLDHSGQTFFTPNKKSRQHSKNRAGVGSLAGVLMPRMRLRDRKTKIIPQKPSNLRALRRDSHAQLAPRVPRGTRGSNSAFRLERSTLARMELENHAQEQFVRGACGGLNSQASSASVSSGSLGLAHVQSVVAACQSGQLGARNICVQPISSELSFLIFTVPYPMGLNALMDSQDNHGSAAILGCYGGLENVIIKQIQSKMWLVAGTVRSSEISCADPKQKNDLMGPSSGETDSAYGDISDDCSHSPGEQLLEKNQRWSPEDDRLLREWVENGRPWSWIIRQFPMRTPGSVRTRYSMLRRKPTQS